MHKFSVGLRVALSMGMLAGCQAEGMKFRIADQRVPEQVGLSVEVLGDFGRAGILATQPLNLPQAYLRTGELGLRLYRFTNSTRETVEVYPSAGHSLETPAATLTQDFSGICPREVYRCVMNMDGTISYPLADLISEYFSEFDFLGSEFRFDSGGTEKVTLDPSTDSPRPVRIRAGESAIWVARFGLRAGSAFISSAPLTMGVGNPGLLFVPALGGVDPETRIARMESLLGIRFAQDLELGLLARNPRNDELNPVYLLALPAPLVFVHPEYRDPRFPFPPTKTARRINGLADQI